MLNRKKQQRMFTLCHPAINGQHFIFFGSILSSLYFQALISEIFQFLSLPHYYFINSVANNGIQLSYERYAITMKIDSIRLMVIPVFINSEMKVHQN